MKIIKGIWGYDWLELLLIIMMALIVVMIVMRLSMNIDDNKKWETFKRIHSCKVVCHISSGTQPGICYGTAANGQTITVFMSSITSDRTGWICDDGVTYWR
jgi:hypothetical protein